MATDSIKKTGTDNLYKSNRGGATLVTEPVIGIVKNNVDPTHSGRIEVYIASFGGADPDVKKNWTPVRYMSPFMGLTSPGGNVKDGPDKEGRGKFVGNPQSYGFWASSPDIGTEVVCIFVNGRIDQGYYIGCIPKAGLLQMTPAMGASDKFIPNEAEAKTYGGSKKLPTSEVNYSNPAVRKSPTVYNEPKPIHSYQASILANQGLIRDNIRGVISSSAQRESPSKVFGISTPGGAIYEGGYNAAAAVKAAKTVDESKLKMIGRTGGHSIVMDDGTLTGQDQLMRLRTSGGHQIMMSDTGQTMFIIHSNGSSWIELGKEGTIDIYATNSFNVRTQGDLNLHADRNVNIHAKEKLNLYGGTIRTESSDNLLFKAGGKMVSDSSDDMTFKSGGGIAIKSDGAAGLTAGGDAFVSGGKVNLNSGEVPVFADSVKSIQKTSHVDTAYSKSVGWMNPAPSALSSITSRAPAHQPWVGSSKGVNVKINNVAPGPDETTTPTADAVNSSTPSTPANPVSPAELKTAPQASSTPDIAGSTVTALASQNAKNAQSMTDAEAAKEGVLDKVSGLTTKQAEESGVIAKGSGGLVSGLVEKGMPVAKALASSLMTGKGGASSPSSLTNGGSAASGAVQTVITGAAKMLKDSGTLTGNESPAQMGGMVMAGIKKGASYVSDLFKKSPSDVKDTLAGDTSLADSVASGKSAGGLADSISSGFGGLKTSLGGMMDSVGSSIMGAGSSLMSGLQSASSAVEKSFTAMTAGQPNTPAPEKSAAQTAAGSYESAVAEMESAETKMLEAKRDYRMASNSANYDKLQTAEAEYNAAAQRVAQISSSYVKTASGAKSSAGNMSLTSAAAKASKFGLDNLASASKMLGLSGTATSALKFGLEKLPGAANSLMGMVDGSSKSGNPVTGLLDKAKAAGSTAVASASGALDSAKNMFSSDTASSIPDLPAAADLPDATALLSDDALSGDVMENASSAFDDIGGDASSMMAELETGLDCLGGDDNAEKPAVAASNTIDNSAQLAKTASLMGSSKISPPVFSDKDTSADIDAMIAKQNTALTAVEAARAEVELAETKLAVTYQSIMSGARTETQMAHTIETQQADISDAKRQLAAAEKKYSSTLV